MKSIIFSLVVLTVLYAVLSVLAFRLAVKYGTQEAAAGRVVGSGVAGEEGGEVVG